MDERPRLNITPAHRTALAEWANILTFVLAAVAAFWSLGVALARALL